MISLVKTNYVEEINPAAKFQGAYSAMLNSLDRFSSYLSPGETIIYRAFQSGRAYATGIFGNKTLDYFYVVDVRPDSPAFGAGLRTGDLIKGVNGKSIFGKSYWQMYLKLLTGEKETLALRVLKKESGREVQIEVETAVSKGNLIHHQLGDHIHRLELGCLNEDCFAKIKSFLSARRPEKIILDLRWYRGGTFNGFKKLAGLFVQKDTSLMIKTRKGTVTTLLGSEDHYKGKAVVLIGQSTVMYGEILAALLKGQGKHTGQRILLMGQTTGRFSARLRHFAMEDGSSILLTEGLYVVNNRDINRNGVQPHIQVKEKDLPRMDELAVNRLNSL